MTLKHYHILLLTLCISVHSYAQKSKKELKGDTYFMGYSFYKAIDVYKSATPLSADGQSRLAQAYVNIGKYKEAEEVYVKIVQLSSASPDDFYNYASVLNRNGKYDEANVWMKRFKDLKPNDLRVKEYTYNKASTDKLLNDVNKYKITNLEMNTSADEFSPAFYADKILFASNRDRKKAVKYFYNWDQKPFLDIYMADIAEDGQQLNNVRFFDKKLNKKYNDGPAAYSYLDQTIAYTKNNYVSKTESGAIKLQIYFKTIRNNEWQEEVAFSLNSNDYNVTHPWLSHDGNTMYFASDMAGGYGGVDLYKVYRDINGGWGKPVNLGPTVNTEGNEIFPFIEEVRGALFFASNGHQGLGGLDIFVAPLRGDTAIGKALNMGYPLNTQYDDFGLIMNDEMTKGYFSSNRSGGKGGDDIYFLEMKRKIVYQKVIKGIVKNDKGEPLTNTIVKLIDENDSIGITYKTPEDGAFSFDVDDGKTFKIKATKDKYDEYTTTISTLRSKDLIYSNITLIPTPEIDIQITVTDKANKEAIKGVVVKVASDNSLVDSTQTSLAGKTRIGLPASKLNTNVTYSITVIKDGYLNKTIVYSQQINRLGKYDVTISMDKLQVGADMITLLELPAFVFGAEQNLFNIPNPVLDKIIQTLNINPRVVMEIAVHTSCEGSAPMNASFTQKRADILLLNFKPMIIDPLRISGRGYGESKLKNNCACEGSERTPCSPEEHKQNERVEFIITGMYK
jgi:outer membrane protein OmpA-like peptidoglycan-associated protein